MNKPIIITVSAKARHGKDTFADAFKKVAEEQKYRVLTIHYADILKYVCKEYFRWDGKKDEVGRHILQYVGTDLCRKNHPDVWVNCVIELVKGLQTEYEFVIIPDTRFPNEINAWENTDFFNFTIRINRVNEDGTEFDNGLTPEAKSHLSEIALDDYGFNYTVENKDIGDLEVAAQAILEDILKLG